MSLADPRNIPKDILVLETLIAEAPTTICRILHDYYDKDVIILIDEYDVPLYKAYLEGYYDDMVRLLRSMFESLLKINDYLEFSVITGCLRISKESIFTGMNNVFVWDNESGFSRDYFGFTEEEVAALFQYYSMSDLLDVARAWYDGYCFGRMHVYCPWDILNFAARYVSCGFKKPGNYWTDSSSNDLLLRILQEDAPLQEEYVRLLAGGTIRKAISTDLTYRDLDGPGEKIWSLLVLTGYLTIEKYLEDSDIEDSGNNSVNVDEDDDDSDENEELLVLEKGVMCELKIPNREIRSLFGEFLYNWYNSTFHTSKAVLDAFCDAFPKRDPNKAEDSLAKILYDVTSARDMAAQDQQKEYFYHGTALGLLYNKWRVRSNIQSGDGYCDLGFFCTKKLAIVIEMNMTKRI